MASTSEKGNAKNVANFQSLISFANGYGENYNPSKNALKVDQLNALYTAAHVNLTKVVSENTAYNNAVNNRAAAFKDLKPFATRVFNALQSTDAQPEKIADAKGFNKKIQGVRAKAVAQPDPNVPAPKTISTSQQSYDQQIQHLDGLISILESEPSYSPNEPELQVANIQSKKEKLIDKNSAVAIAYAAVSNARIARDKTIYGAEEGLIEVAADVKKYVKSVFGATSPQFAQIKGIDFTKQKK